MRPDHYTGTRPCFQPLRVPPLRLGRADRPMLRAQRIRRQLGSEDGLDEPDEPKGKHWSTYNRLLDRADEPVDPDWGCLMGGLLRRVG